MSNLSFKIGKLKTDIIVVNWSEKLIDKNTLVWWQKKNHIENTILGSKTSKKLKFQKWTQKSSTSSY